MAVKQVPMNADFARGYVQEFFDEGAIRDARWKSVVEIARVATHLTVEVLVRVAFATKAPPAGYKHEELEAVYKTVLDAICATDSNFDPVKDARDFQFVCGSALRRLFETKPDAALAVTTASFGGHRKTNLSFDITDLARASLVSLAASQHVRLDPKELEIVAPKLEFEVSEEAAANNSGWKDEIEALRDEMAQALVSTSAKHNEITRALVRRLALADEELQMLWWLMGGRSHELHVPFSKIEAAVQPLMLGCELGNLTKVAPGPASVGAMLAQAGLTTRKIKLEDAVNSVEADWAKTTSEQKTVSPATTPIHYALERRTEMGSTDAWQTGWEAQTGLSASAALTAVQLAELVYQERLFLYVNA